MRKGLAMDKQRDKRQTFTCDGVRGDAIFAFRRMLDVKEIEEGEYLSKLFEQAVLHEFGGAGEPNLNWFKKVYQDSLDNN